MAQRKTELDKLIEDIRGKHAKRMNAILLTSSDENSDKTDEFAVNFFKMLEYASPKLQRSEIIEETKEQIITIVHVAGTGGASGDASDGDASGVDEDGS